ncbi:MAG TPA: helix-turn-helix transcriptional regulator [Thermomicrobiales bacterium]|nr:helix-turn-helix transcriptional regulator [Thermomicrobiales bacterium]
MTVGERLRYWRERRALSQRELAAAAGVAQNTIWRTEQGQVAAHPATLRKLAAALGVRVDQLTAEDPPGLGPGGGRG